MTIEELSTGVAVISALIALASTIWGFITSGSRSNAKAIGEINTRLLDVEAGQSSLRKDHEALQHEIEQMPDREMIHRIELSLVELRGDLGQMNERLKPVGAIAERMQELMLQGGKS
jgi:hypothetical protein